MNIIGNIQRVMRNFNDNLSESNGLDDNGIIITIYIVNNIKGKYIFWFGSFKNDNIIMDNKNTPRII
jgi:hypothetical protein